MQYIEENHTSPIQNPKLSFAVINAQELGSCKQRNSCSAPLF